MSGSRGKMSKQDLRELLQSNPAQDAIKDLNASMHSEGVRAATDHIVPSQRKYSNAAHAKLAKKTTNVLSHDIELWNKGYLKRQPRRRRLGDPIASVHGKNNDLDSMVSGELANGAVPEKVSSKTQFKQMLDLVKRGYERIRQPSSKRNAKHYWDKPIPNVRADFLEGKKTMKPYQKDGTGILVHDLKTHGYAMLCDEMGVGKTLQMIATIGCYDGKKPTLLVVPNGALQSARDEIENAQLFGGNVLDWEAYKGAKGKTARDLNVEEIEKYRLVLVPLSELTTVAPKAEKAAKDFLLRRNGYYQKGDKAGRPVSLDDERQKCSLLLVEWGLVVVDEAHAMRNAERVAFRSCLGLKADARLAVTGTFLVNYQSDILSLMRFLRIEPFASDPKCFERYFQTKKKRGRIPPKLNKRRSYLLSLIMAAFTIRRFQGERFEGELIASQDWKWENLVEFNLNDKEQEVQKELEHLWLEVKKKEKVSEEDEEHVLAKINRLRLSLLHPACVKQEFEESAKRGSLRKSENASKSRKSRKAKQGDTQNDQSDAPYEALERAVATYDKDGIKGWRSSLLVEASKRLEANIGDGAIIYCEWVRGLHAAKVMAKETCPESEVFFYKGSMTKSERRDHQKKFNKACKMARRKKNPGPPPILLLSSAGNVGLNLKHASVILHISAYWNYMTQVQPTYRGLRFGRKRKFVSALFRPYSSISKRHDQLRDFKRDLGDSIVISRDDPLHLATAKLRAERPEDFCGRDNAKIWNKFPGRMAAAKAERNEMLRVMKGLAKLKWRGLKIEMEKPFVDMKELAVVAAAATDADKDEEEAYHQERLAADGESNNADESDPDVDPEGDHNDVSGNRSDDEVDEESEAEEDGLDQEFEEDDEEVEMEDLEQVDDEEVDPIGDFERGEDDELKSVEFVGDEGEESDEDDGEESDEDDDEGSDPNAADGSDEDEVMREEEEQDEQELAEGEDTLPEFNLDEFFADDMSQDGAIEQ